MRKLLNTLYSVSTAMAACCLITIASLVILHVFGRLIDGTRKAFGFEPIGLQIPSLGEFAGFLLVGASFLALAGTLRLGDHIRVTILLQAVSDKTARLLNVWCLGVAFVLAGFFTWNAGLLAYDSHLYHEVSVGIIPVPLVYPQAIMTFGLFVFSISLLDDLVTTALGNAPSFESLGDKDLIEGRE
ncbi:TRAP transporter small permease [Roseibium sediminis]|uniref:TRAP transporter small permease n=1 Tax=Roseibium sediminis TaxID=1775174 RepID=UPI00123CFCAC|nr:TRAP transporter small permease [Roseibium sediminis]